MLIQPGIFQPIIPREWVHQYHSIEITRTEDNRTLTIPCTASNFFLMDLNPIWYVDQLIKNKEAALFILYLDTTNSCSDRCPMCFTEKTRKLEGFQRKLDVDLALMHISKLRERYYDTFKMISLAGPGEPLNHKDILKLLEGCSGLGTAVRVYTAGKRLEEQSIRDGLLRFTKLVRISTDAASASTFTLTHGINEYNQRIKNIHMLVEDKIKTKSDALIGQHFVIQKENMKEIKKFAKQAKNLGMDFIVYSQETFYNVRGSFNQEEHSYILDSLSEVELMHTPQFRVVVPRLVKRQTYSEFTRDVLYSPEILNKCHNCKHRIFFGVQNDFSACWLATIDQHFRKESLIGSLDSSDIIDSITQIINRGVGSLKNKGAYLSCNSCVASNYNAMVDQILNFVADRTDFKTRLIQHLPGINEEEKYELILNKEC